VSLSSWEYSLARAYLSSHSADQVPHVGGTLMKHLRGTCDLLRQWDRPGEICLAGLCHTAYGTDGYPNPLEDPTRRDRLAAIIGREAEELVYFYASCDRCWLYPQLVPGALVGIHDVETAKKRMREAVVPARLPEASAGTPITFRDRFSGKVIIPAPEVFSSFLELTFANELEIIRGQWPHLPEENRVLWQAIFERCRSLVSEAAYDCFRETFELDRRNAAA
jgi:hypothetical protein